MADSDDTPRKSPHLRPPWKPGQSGNPAGRPKGARSKLSEDFFVALAADFAEHGVKAIEDMRKDRPQEYVKAIAGLQTKELNVTVNDYDDLTDDELAEQFSVAAARLASGGNTARLGISAPSESEGGKGKPPRVH